MASASFRPKKIFPIGNVEKETCITQQIKGVQGLFDCPYLNYQFYRISLYVVKAWHRAWLHVGVLHRLAEMLEMSLFIMFVF